MSALYTFFSDNRLLLVVCVLGVMVLGINLALLSMLRGRRPIGDAAAAFIRAAGGGRQAHRAQTAALDELHKAVAEFRPNAAGPEQPHE